MAKVADGIRYAERVVAGNIIACEFVRLACQRFLDDLKFGEERGVYFMNRVRSIFLIFTSLCLTLKALLLVSRLN
jgi:phage terminase large subunit-like protein